MNLRFVVVAKEVAIGVGQNLQAFIETSFSKMEGMTVSSHTLSAGGPGPWGL
jgi:hypothetical protein